MKNLRRLVVTLAVLLVALLCLTATVSAAEIVDSGTCGDNLTWTLDDEGTLTISGTGKMTDYAAGETPWNEMRFEIKQIIIKNGVTGIGAYAFWNSENLTGITIPDSVTSIGTYALSSIDTITEITIPDSVTSIGKAAFLGCGSLTNINIPDSVTSIGEAVFQDCSSLTQITLPESMTSIVAQMFRNCSSLTEFTISENVTSIGESAFNGCSSLTNFTIPDSVISIGGFAFNNCSSLIEIAIPEGVTSIGEAMFAGCSSLTEIIIPDSVTSIGESAFLGCSSLTEITLPKNVTSISDSMFKGCSKMTSFTIPETITSIGDDAFAQCSRLAKIIIPESVTSIGEYAFAKCKKLDNVRIPESVTSIGNYAFWECKGLTSITLPAGMTGIGYSMFSECSSLVDITLPASVTSIGDHAFDECSSLTSITLPDGLTSIGNDAFADCSSLSELVLPGSVTDIGEYAFSACSSLSEIVIPDSVTNLSRYAFEKCSSALVAYLPANLKTVPAHLFSDCYSLQIVFLPASVTKIAEYAFSGCDSLTEIYYLGNEEQLNEIQVYTGNDPVLYANVYLLTVITKEPEDAYAVDGATVKFSTDTNRDGCTFQWYYLAPDADEWKPCKESSAKKKTLTITAKEKLDGYYYCCEITDPYGNVGDTRAALLTIVEPPKITTQPKNAAAPEGSTAKVTVKAKGDGLEYQWYIKNAGKDKFSKSSVTSATYSCKMSEKTDGRQVYCVVTDQYGNTVKSKTVTIYMGNPAKITTQPANAAAPEGKVAKATVKATGDDITYTWYIKNPGKSSFSKSSVTSATYSCKMSEKTDGRQAYCVITDKYGTSVKTKTVTLYMGNPIKIISQPKDAVNEQDMTAKATVKATGDGLTYQWYIKNPGKSKFGKSSTTSATYVCKMTAATNGRQAYCVITDEKGMSVQTDTVTFYMGNPARITTQPRDAIAPTGEKVKTTVKATGDGITYQWYIKNPGKSKFSKSSVTSATYSCKMSESIDGRQAYCVVTDKYGTSVQSKTVTLAIGNPVAIVTQPQSVSAAAGETVKTTVEATGEGLTYQWYIRNPGKEKFGKSSVTSATYSVTVSEKTDGREAYCVITDKYGNSVQTETILITMEEAVHTHTPETVEIEPTCNEAGKLQTVCAECGEVLETVENPEQPALGHDWVETSNTATCTTDGTKTSECSRCLSFKTESAPATGHVSTHVETKEPTCTVNGWEKTICDKCGEQVGATDVLPAPGEHTHEAAVVADAAKEYREHWNSENYAEYLSYSDIVCQRCTVCYEIDKSSFAYRYTPEEVTQMMLEYVNQLRAEAGLTALTAGADQITLAAARAEAIAADFTQSAEHKENIAKATTLSDCVLNFYNAFLESSEQKANLLAEDAITFGCAIYYQDGTVYCVQIFA